jgi:rhamnosyltransferase
MAPDNAGMSIDGCRETVSQGSHRVAACVVSYNPGPEVRGVLCSVLPQVSTVFVIDNASNKESTLALEGLCAQLGATLVANEENIGVAGAYNQAAKVAVSQGYEWMLLLDQDSVAPVGLVSQLMCGVDRWRGTRLSAVVCPTSIESEHTVHKSADPGADTPVKTCLNAGSMVRLAAWEAVGGYDEGLFVDYVDFDFCFRCRRRGWEIIQVGGAVMVHTSGTPTRHRILWTRPVTWNRPAPRRYYIARNRILFYRKYWRFDTRWVLRDVCYALKEMALLVLFESSTREKLRAIGAGIVDGCRGVTGKTQRKQFVS